VFAKGWNDMIHMFFSGDIMSKLSLNDPKPLFKTSSFWYSCAYRSSNLVARIPNQETLCLAFLVFWEAKLQKIVLLMNQWLF